MPPRGSPHASDGRSHSNLAGMINHSAHSWAGLATTPGSSSSPTSREANLRLYLHFGSHGVVRASVARVRLLVGLICLFAIPFTGLGRRAVLFQDHRPIGSRRPQLPPS